MSDAPSSDGSSSTDGPSELDAGFGADAASARDAGIGADAVARPDAAAPRDASTPSDAGSAGCPSSDPYVCQMLDAHNRVRANATPAPTPPLPPLTWSSAAAAVATSWANNCQWMHNTGAGYGENLAASSGSGDSPARVVNDWASEAADYDYASNSCSGVCGHYTQLVWRATTSVGCATVTCNTGSPFGSGSWTFTVCDYAPPGNWVGQRPY